MSAPHPAPGRAGRCGARAAWLWLCLGGWPGLAAADVKVAVIETHDPYTHTAGLCSVFETLGAHCKDLTGPLREGHLKPAAFQLLVVASHATADPRIRSALCDQRQTLQHFMAKGAMVAMLAQSAHDEPQPDWLPAGLSAIRGRRDVAMLSLRDRNHSLWNRPHALTEHDFADWAIASGPLGEPATDAGGCADAFRGLVGFRVLAAGTAQGDDPCVVVARHERGRVLLAQLAIDKVALAGKPVSAQKAARAWLANLLQEAGARAPRGANRPAVDPPYHLPATRDLSGTVFDDRNGNGTQDHGESGRAGTELVLWPDGRVLTTDAQGRFTTEIAGDATGTIATSVPDGYHPTTPWWRSLNEAAGSFAFGLQADTKTAPRPYCIAHLTDLHLGGRAAEVEMEAVREAAATVNLHVPSVQQVIVTGDLTIDGSFAALQRYRDSIRAFRAPVRQLMGNHDFGSGPEATRAYDTLLGPPGSWFEAHGWRFVLFYQESLKSEMIRWARHAVQSSRLPVAVALHHFPRRSTLDELARPETGQTAVDIRLVLAGDWHDASASRIGGRDYVLSAPTLFGGWDHSPAAVRFVCLAADGTVTTDSRYLRMREWIAVAAPWGSHVGSGGPLVVHAYHSDSPVRSVAATWAGPGAATGRRAPQASLKQVGTFTWRSDLPLQRPGRYTIVVQAQADDGTRWQRHMKYRVAAAPAKALVPRAAAAPDWPTFRGDLARTGIRPEPLEPPLQLAWVAHLGGEVYQNGPLIHHGLVIVATMDRLTLGAQHAAVTALERETGRVRWRIATRSSVRNSPTIAGDLVLWQEEHGLLRAVEWQTGVPRWQYNLGETDPPQHAHHLVSASPLAWSHGVLLALPNKLRVIDLLQGRMIQSLGSLDSPSAVTYASPLQSDDLILMPTRNRGLWAYRQQRDATLKLAWKKEGVTISATPVAADNELYVATHEGLMVLNRETGSTKHVYMVGTKSSPASPLVTDNLIVIAGGDGQIVGLRRTDGAERWRISSGPALMDFLPYRMNSQAFSNSPIAAGSFAYVGGLDGWLYAVDLRAGMLRWRRRIGLPLAAPFAVSGNLLIAVDFGGNVYAFCTK